MDIFYFMMRKDCPVDLFVWLDQYISTVIMCDLKLFSMSKKLLKILMMAI